MAVETFKLNYLLLKILALVGVVKWVGRQPVNQRVTGFIPSQCMPLGCRPGPQWGVCERQPHIDVSLLLFLPLSPLWK